MKEEIKNLKEDIKFYKRISESIISNRTERNKKTLKIQLLNEIQEFLTIDDIIEISKHLKLSKTYISSVLNGNCSDEIVLNVLFDKALTNKAKQNKNYQEMINELKR